MKKLLCSILAVVTAFSFASCEFKSPENVIKVNGEDVSSGIYLIYQYLAYSNAANIAADGEKNILKQTIEELPAEEWIHNETITNIKNYIYVAKAFEEKGFSFTQDELATMTAQAEDTYNTNSKMFAKNGIGLKSYIELFISARKDAKILEEFKSKDENKVTDDEIVKYTEENYVNIARVNFPVTDKDSKELSDEQRSAIDAIAKELEAKINGGTLLNSEIAEEYIKKALEAAGREFTENSVDSYFSTSYLSEDAVSYYYTDDMKTQMLASEKGKAKISEISDVPFVWGRIEMFPSDEDFEEYKDSLIQEIQGKAYVEETKLITESYTVEENASAVKHYSLKKVRLQ